MGNEICHVEDCTKLVYVKKHGVCQQHYHRWRRNGDYLARKNRNPKERERWLREKLASADRSTCWLDWPFSMTADGYCQSSYQLEDGQWKGERAHRLAVLWDRGEDIESQIASHLCHDRACFNPDHVRMGTQLENMALSRQKRLRGDHEWCPTCGQDWPQEPDLSRVKPVNEAR